MNESQVAPYGSWKSPITPDLIVSEVIGLGQIALDGPDTYWEETRPSEGGRHVLVHRTPDGRVADLTPPPYNVRTRVHEYGGGAFTVAGGVVYFANFEDQRLYRKDPGAQPRPVTPEAQLRYADGVMDPARNRLVCVREDHTVAGREAVNALVGLDGAGGDPGRVLVAGNDFYASPRLSPDGSTLAWLTWNHPNMPWDATELWLGRLGPDGSIGETTLVAGGEGESIFQPEWSPDGVLHFVSDRTGWWNLYRRRNGRTEPLAPLEAEFGKPQWVFGASSYGFTSPHRIICAYTREGIWRLASLDTRTARLEPFDLPYSEMSRGDIKVAPGRVVFEAASATEAMALVELDPATGEHRVLKKSSSIDLDQGYISRPEPIEFPTEDGLASRGLYYPPRNRDFEALPPEKPPLLVKSHGGPTGAASAGLNWTIQYWTSRGFAVLDVNYGGSAGFGREYRERLLGSWGIVDVADCVNGALYLVQQGKADAGRLAIDGGSAGGYTTLASLVFRDVFKAGASYYGISDLEALARDTHKFESRYLDRLVGPYPEARQTYLDRSPIHFTHRLSCPLILFQGLEDEIVPPNQAKMMYDAVVQKGLPAAYLTFEGEQHGFRKAKNIRRALEAELYFYSRVFGFKPGNPLSPVTIQNL